MLDIYDFGIIASLIAAIVFVIKEQEKKALISFIILLAIMVLKYMNNQ